MTDRGTSRALIDAEGRLVRADDALAALNARAGGGVGRPLAVPQLATLARLARRLGVLVSRGVTVADEGDDVALWVRAEPLPDGVSLAVAGWRQQRAWQPSAAAELAPAPEERWECDAALRLVAVAPEAGVRFGFEAAAVLGRPLTQLLRLEEGPSGELPILVATGLRQGFVGQRATVRGSEAGVELAALARLDPAGGFAGFDGTIRPAPVPADGAGVTRIFASRLDRALRAPLGRIVAQADSIHAQADGPLGQDYVDYAADIASAGRHLIGLIDDLSDLQAIERDDFEVAREPLDLADVARRAAGLLGVRAADAGVRIDRPGADETLAATGEFRRALQVMVNLVGNAVRYSPGGGSVWLRLAHEGGRAVVVVADQGKGIAVADQARIFDRFERLDRSEVGGNGLGLYIARRLARAMGGDLTVNSAPGQGARFTFSLPAG